MKQRLTVKRALLASAILMCSACQVNPDLNSSAFPGLFSDNGQILPGSKGDRKQFQQLEARVQIPLVRFESQGFALQSQTDIDQQLKAFRVMLNGEAVEALYQSHRVTETDVEAVFVLKEAVFEPYLFHEIVFSTSAGLPQLAALWAHDTLDETVYLELDDTSTARWILAAAYQRERGEPVQSLPLASYQDLVDLPEVPALVQKVRTLPTQALLGAQAEIQSGIDKLKARRLAREKQAAENNAGNQGSGQSSNNGSGQPENPGAQGNNGSGQSGNNGANAN